MRSTGSRNQLEGRERSRGGRNWSLAAMMHDDKGGCRGCTRVATSWLVRRDAARQPTMRRGNPVDDDGANGSPFDLRRDLRAKPGVEAVLDDAAGVAHRSGDGLG
jgi:hypothetical protein